ncbi:MAG: hypothetical protein Fur0041_17490 [Bacteroidia bacterium]
MKHIIAITLFLIGSTVAFAQYTHVETGPNGNKISEGQYDKNPGILSTDNKQTIAQKMATVHKIGNWKYWFDNGQLSAEEHYDNSGNPTGIWKTYHINGKIASETNFATGKTTIYHPNGNKAEEGTINKQHQRTGNWQGWYESGKLNYTGAYDNTGNKKGTWTFYTEDGVVSGKENH